jgi:hypothetical protein
MHPTHVGEPITLTATAQVGPAADTTLLGWYVNSTTAGTLVLRRGTGSGTVVTGTITPAVGWHPFPGSFPGGCHATIGGTLNVTFLVVPYTS